MISPPLTAQETAQENDEDGSESYEDEADNETLVEMAKRIQARRK
jgi:hypothetical protein